MLNGCRPFHLLKCHHLVAAFGDALMASGGRLILTRRHSQVVDGERMFEGSLEAVTPMV